MRERVRYVYIVRSDAGPVKIGWSSLVESRVLALQHNSAFLVTLLRKYPGGANVERAFHRAFRHCKIGGEWFVFDEAMLTLCPNPVRKRTKLTKPRPRGWTALKAIAKEKRP